MKTLFDDFREIIKHPQKQNEASGLSPVEQIEKINRNTKLFKRCFAIALLMLSIVLGIVLGRTAYRHEVRGANTVCYTTNYGSCYHAGYCYYLRSSNKTNVYAAQQSGYRECSRCSVGPLDRSYKNEFGHGFGTAGIGAITVYIFGSIARKKKEEEKITFINRISPDSTR